MLGAIEIAVIAAVVGGLAIALWRSLNERQSVERWARDSGLRLTSDNRAYVAAYLRRTRMFRLVGGSSACSCRGSPSPTARCRSRSTSDCSMRCSAICWARWSRSSASNGHKGSSRVHHSFLAR